MLANSVRTDRFESRRMTRIRRMQLAASRTNPSARKIGSIITSTNEVSAAAIASGRDSSRKELNMIQDQLNVCDGAPRLFGGGEGYPDGIDREHPDRRNRLG